MLSGYVDIISENISPDHVHMLVSVSPHLSVLKVVRYTEGESNRKQQ
ncbi:MAG: transposase [Alphaproteobacteria bacterium]|nr:transposase [Alphaproteobacteria bacterium]